MHKTAENELLTRMKAGDETAFLEIYKRWQNLIYRFAWQMSGSPQLAEDITQEVFLLLIKNKLHFDPSKGSFSSFIYGVARNISLRALRKNQRYFGFLNIFESQRLNRPGHDPLDHLTEEEMSNALRRCILSLPPSYREMVVLCDLHELSYAEAAEVTGCAVGTVRSRLHRGRELLLQKMRTTFETSRENKGGTRYEIPAL